MLSTRSRPRRLSADEMLQFWVTHVDLWLNDKVTQLRIWWLDVKKIDLFIGKKSDLCFWSMFGAFGHKNAIINHMKV